MPEQLRSLGNGGTIEEQMVGVDSSILERFLSPLRQGQGDRGAGAGQCHGTIEIKMEHDEFTCHCPVTRQPDYGRIHIQYTPMSWCVESKSLKLYLASFRDAAIFHEAVAQRICDDLVELLSPQYVRVTFEAAPRGGIAFVPTASFRS